MTREPVVNHLTTRSLSGKRITVPVEEDEATRFTETYKLQCVPRKRKHAVLARQGVNLTRGDDAQTKCVLLIYARLARPCGVLKESRAFLSPVRRNNLAARTGRAEAERVSGVLNAHRCSSSAYVARWLALRSSCYYFTFLLAVTRCCARALGNPRIHTRKAIRFDDGSFTHPSSFHVRDCTYSLLYRSSFFPRSRRVFSPS